MKLITNRLTPDSKNDFQKYLIDKGYNKVGLCWYLKGKAVAGDTLYHELRNFKELQKQLKNK